MICKKAHDLQVRYAANIQEFRNEWVGENPKTVSNRNREEAAKPGCWVEVQLIRNWNLHWGIAGLAQKYYGAAVVDQGALNDGRFAFTDLRYNKRGNLIEAETDPVDLSYGGWYTDWVVIRISTNPSSLWYWGDKNDRAGILAS